MGLCILCPGQGDQHPRMMQLVQEEAAAKVVFEEATEALGEDPRDWLLTPREFYRNRFAQPLLCVAQLATWTVLRGMLPAPRLFAGYSIGELAAYGCADAVGCRELTLLARRRALLMESATAIPSGLLAVSGLGRDQVERLCQGEEAQIAIVNARDRFVLGAAQACIRELQQAVERQGGRATPLAVGVASHTAGLASASEAFRAILTDSALRAPMTPVLAGINGLPVYTREAAVETLARQISTPLDWAACLNALPEMGCTLVLELGPGIALSRMARQRWPEIPARSVEEFHSLAGVVEWVGRWL